MFVVAIALILLFIVPPQKWAAYRDSAWKKEQ
jgi:hypothetical protein